MTMHPRFRQERRRLRDLTSLHPSLFDQTISLSIRWREALAKDVTGHNCVLLVDDLVEA